MLPDHPPDALQLVALVEDQVSVLDWPLLTVVGLAASEIDGAGLGPGPPSFLLLTSLPPELQAESRTTSAVNLSSEINDRMPNPVAISAEFRNKEVGFIAFPIQLRPTDPDTCGSPPPRLWFYGDTAVPVHWG